MGIRDRYEHGVFCWVDLATIDAEAAKPFYQQLFGWTFEDMPVEGMPPYVMAFKGSHRVAARFSMSEDMRSLGALPRWESYINVEDLDVALQSWQSLGGRVIKSSCEVEDAGLMAVVQDPTGAFVRLWQAKSHIGAGVVNEVNTYCWPELQTRGADKAAEFYAAVFDWETLAQEKPPYYISAKVKGHYNCGMFDLDRANLPVEIPPHWEVYFNVENIDKAISIVRDLNGKPLMDPLTIPEGRFATITDPQGAVFTIIEPTEVDD